MMQVAIGSAEPRPVDRRVYDVTGHRSERAAQSELHVGGVRECIGSEEVRGLLFVQRRWHELAYSR